VYLCLRALAPEQALKVGDKDLDLVTRIEEINGRQSPGDVYREWNDFCQRV